MYDRTIFAGNQENIIDIKLYRVSGAKCRSTFTAPNRLLKSILFSNSLHNVSTLAAKPNSVNTVRHEA
jgi:hypothetical protein